MKCKGVFLTYSDTDYTPDQKDPTISKEIIRDFALKNFPVSKWVIAEELHDSGRYHFHAAFWFNSKVQSKNPRCFDIDKWHPNIKTRGKNTKAWDQHTYEYTIKCGKYIESKKFMVPIFAEGSKNYRNKKADFEAWLNDRKEANRVAPSFFKLPHTEDKEQLPTKAQRKAIYLIHGKPGCGKTCWVNQEFEDKEVFFRGTPQYPYEGYKGEQVIVWDDIKFSKKDDHIYEIINVLNVAGSGNQHVWGNTRYNKVFWPKGQQRVLIILLNTDKVQAADGWGAVFADERIQTRMLCRVHMKRESRETEYGYASDFE